MEASIQLDRARLYCRPPDKMSSRHTKAKKLLLKQFLYQGLIVAQTQICIKVWEKFQIADKVCHILTSAKWQNITRDD